MKINIVIAMAEPTCRGAAYLATSAQKSGRFAVTLEEIADVYLLRTRLCDLRCFLRSEMKKYITPFNAGLSWRSSMTQHFPCSQKGMEVKPSVTCICSFPKPYIFILIIS